MRDSLRRVKCSQGYSTTLATIQMTISRRGDRWIINLTNNLIEMFGTYSIGCKAEGLGDLSSAVKSFLHSSN